MARQILSATPICVWGRSGSFAGCISRVRRTAKCWDPTLDFATGGTVGVGFRAAEAVGNPFTRAGQWRLKLTSKETYLRARQAYERHVRINPQGFRQAGERIAETRVQRLHAEELLKINAMFESLAFQVPGFQQSGRFEIPSGQMVTRAEIDAVTESGWIQVKTGKGFDQFQAYYTSYGSPTGRSIFYVEHYEHRQLVGQLHNLGVSEVRPLTPSLRCSEPFPLPYRGATGVTAAKVPWGFITRESGRLGSGAAGKK
jgi:hypothetical protein